MAISRQSGGTDKATDDLINEAIQITEVARRGGNVTTAQIDNAYKSIAGNMKMSPDQLTAELGKAGITPQTLRNRLKAQISWNMLMQARMAREARLKAKEVSSVIQSGKEKDAGLVREYILQQIIFIAPKGSSTDLVAQRRREAEAFRQRFKDCDSSVDQAKALKNVVVKAIGRRDTTQMPGQMAEMLKTIPAGKTSSAMPGEQGIEVIAVCSVREVHSTEVAEERVATKLALAGGDEIGKDYLAELRKYAIIIRR
jgi:peptidyl-prolyl cis-trans isomerase SurA